MTIILNERENTITVVNDRNEIMSVYKTLNINDTRHMLVEVISAHQLSEHATTIRSNYIDQSKDNEEELP